MKVNLDKKDLVSLVLGTSPNFGLMENLNPKYGNWTGGFVDKWSWNKYSLEKLSEKDLYELYLLCKESWEK